MTKFKRGVSGNVKGRPIGISDRRTQARALFAEHQEKLIATAIKLALSGDAAALRMCLDRIVPVLKPTGEPLLLPKLPPCLAEKGDTVLRELAVGRIRPEEAAIVMEQLVKQARIVEVSELERRVAALEDGNANS